MKEQVDTLEGKSTDIIVSDENFEDRLDRKKLAKNFVSVLKSQKANVFSINGSWGSGKTWFLKFVEDECSEKEIPFVKFNVWENDYLNDPFSAIIAELSVLLNFSEDQIKELASKVTLNASVGFMGNNIGFEYDPTKNISEYKKSKREKEDFIKLLNEKIKKQTVIAIDELDRCKPDYAIKTLEIIKHFFHIPNIKFILAVDKGQLARTVKCMFGQETDTDCYLRKFVDIEYNLPESSKEKFVEYLVVEKYPMIFEKIKSFGLNQRILDKGYNNWHRKITWVFGANNAEDAKYTKDSILQIFKDSNLCLREIDKTLLRLSIVISKISEQKHYLEVGFLLQLIITNLKDPNSFNSLQHFTFPSGSNNRICYSEFITIYNTMNSTLNNKREHIGEENEAIAEAAVSLYLYYDLINLSIGFE